MPIITYFIAKSFRLCGHTKCHYLQTVRKVKTTVHCFQIITSLVQNVIDIGAVEFVWFNDKHTLRPH